jgi:hypothetical protein
MRRSVLLNVRMQDFYRTFRGLSLVVDHSFRHNRRATSFLPMDVSSMPSTPIQGKVHHSARELSLTDIITITPNISKYSMYLLSVRFPYSILKLLLLDFRNQHLVLPLTPIYFKKFRQV